jgi:hypothetical protein
MDDYEVAEKSILEVVERVEKVVEAAIQQEVETLFPKMDHAHSKPPTRRTADIKHQVPAKHHSPPKHQAVVAASVAKTIRPEVVMTCSSAEPQVGRRWHLEGPYSELLEHYSQYAIF